MQVRASSHRLILPRRHWRQTKTEYYWVWVLGGSGAWESGDPRMVQVSKRRGPDRDCARYRIHWQFESARHPDKHGIMALER